MDGKMDKYIVNIDITSVTESMITLGSPINPSDPNRGSELLRHVKEEEMDVMEYITFLENEARSNLKAFLVSKYKSKLGRDVELHIRDPHLTVVECTSTTHIAQRDLSGLDVTSIEFILLPDNDRIGDNDIKKLTDDILIIKGKRYVVTNLIGNPETKVLRLECVDETNDLVELIILLKERWNASKIS